MPPRPKGDLHLRICFLGTSRILWHVEDLGLRACGACPSNVAVSRAASLRMLMSLGPFLLAESSEHALVRALRLHHGGLSPVSRHLVAVPVSQAFRARAEIPSYDDAAVP